MRVSAPSSVADPGRQNCGLSPPVFQPARFHSIDQTDRVDHRWVALSRAGRPNTFVSVTPQQLSKGANVSIGELTGEPMPRLIFVIETKALEGKDFGLDAGILILGDDGQVRSNEDFIFYNQPTGVGGAVRLVSAGGQDDERDSSGDLDDSLSHRDAIEVDLARIPESVSRIVVTASIDPRTDAEFGDTSLVTLHVAPAEAPEEPIIEYVVEGLGSERALIFGEVYRREDSWKVRAVGQGYENGLAALVSDHGVEVDDESPTDDSASDDEVEGPQDTETPRPASVSSGPGGVVEASPGSELEDETQPRTEDGHDQRDAGAKVSIARKRRPAALPRDWEERDSAYLPRPDRSEWQRARLFPSVGMKSSAEQEMRTTSILLACMETVPEFGRSVLAQAGAPRGRIETFTEVRFTLSGDEVRPDGLIRVSRGGKTWQALVEVKTGRSELNADQIANYLKLAKSKSIDAVLTISRDLMASPDQFPFKVDGRMLKNVELKHLSWEEIVAEAAIVYEHVGVGDRVRSRVLEEMLWYAADVQSGMWSFDDMGRQWVKVREAVKHKTVSASDAATSDVCDRFDRLARHIALYLSAFTGQKITSQPPASRVDTVSRAKQLADSGELFALLRVPGAAGPVAINADLSRSRIGCSLKTTAPRSGRTQTKVNWLTRQLASAPGELRITAHHSGSRVESTSALLRDIREDAGVAMPPDGRDIREFTVTMEASMGSKRSGSENGFVAAMTGLATSFYSDVVERVRSGRDS